MIEKIVQSAYVLMRSVFINLFIEITVIEISGILFLCDIKISRRGGGLITAERRNTGHSRRMLGAMYGPNDIQAQIPKDFQENRRRGYIINYSRDKLFGFVLPFDDPTRNGFFVHIDDCHIYGARFLKRFQEVEFNVVTDASTGKSKALHVSGPNKTVLRSVSDNRYLPTTLTNTKLPIDENARYKGSVMVTSQTNNWFIIKPDEKGFEPVIAYKNNIQSLGHRRIQLDDCLEFNVNEPSEQYEGGLLRATEISAPGGKPILCELGPLGQYLQTKMNLPIYQNELPEYDMETYNKGTILTGFITNWASVFKFGQIEIESPDLDKRYKRIYFKLDDCVLPSSDMNYDTIYIRDGTKVQFELDSIDHNNGEFKDQNRRKIYDTPPSERKNEDGSPYQEQEGIDFHYEDVEPTVFIKAINVMSDGLDYLEMSESNMRPSQIRLDDNDDDISFRPKRPVSFDSDDNDNQKLQLDDDDNIDEDEDDEPLFGDFSIDNDDNNDMEEKKY